MCDEVTHKCKATSPVTSMANNKPEVSNKYEGKEITLTDGEKSYLPEKKIFFFPKPMRV
jgi:hypothetical protein